MKKSKMSLWNYIPGILYVPESLDKSTIFLKKNNKKSLESSTLYATKL